MSVQSFIEAKSKQLTHYVQGFWSNAITYEELQVFLWDLLEEWCHVDNRQYETYTHQERIFWHVLQLLQGSDEQGLNKAPLKNELSSLLAYLNQKSLCPIDVVGMRPSLS